jgi:hypothetical protein
MSDQSRRIADLMAAAEKSVKATERALLALEAMVGQTKEILAELRKAHAEVAPEPARPATRRKRAKVLP